LSDNNARSDVFGVRSLLNVSGRAVAVKTGTTNDQRDNWAIGWTPQIVVGAWVGNNDNSPMKKVASGVSGATPIWNRIISEALSGKPAVSFEVPSSVVTLEVDRVSGYLAHDGFPTRTEYFVKGTEPTGDDPIHANLKVCKSEGRLATPSQVAAGDYDSKEYFVLKEEDPTGGTENLWQKGILEWISTQSDAKYNAPSEFCGSANPVNVEFLSPKDHDQVNSSDFEVRVDAKSTGTIVQVELTVDGDKKYLLSSKPWKVQLTGVGNGVHTLLAVAKDEKGNQSERKVTIGVNVAWNSSQ
jgi:membrane carboxypeptidase/penicillin-binding protein PbpC